MNTTVSVAFDRSAPPANFVVWDRVRNGYNTVTPTNRARDWFTCKSETDARIGACSQGWFHGGGVGQLSTLKIRFTEKRSKVSVDIPVTGRSGSCTYYLTTGSCNPPYWRQINNGGYLQGHNAKLLHIYFTAANLSTVPSGGIWEGTLVLEQRQWGAGAAALKAHWTANITLDVTDRNNGAIYLPAFGQADPLVDLNLRTKPLSTAPGGEVSGSTVIDTCLYDGYNANNAWLQVTLSDLLPPGNRSADIFSVTKTGTTGGNPRDRVDYRVTMNYNGKPVPMENGKAATLTGVDTALIRPVTLPGFPVPVVCTPAPLTLTVQPFAKASKTAGRYSGTLRVNLAARTLAP